MNDADLARLELAKRAYRAAGQPSDAEVQAGVRRARLWLRRPKPRRLWFSKGLVFVVLALGSLAYAKPHALGELVQEMLPRSAQDASKGGGRGSALASDSLPTESSPRTSDSRAASHSSPRPTEPAPAATAATAATADEVGDTAPAVSTRSTSAVKSIGKRAPAPASSKTVAKLEGGRELDPGANATDDRNLSDWGRVGQALARGDETRALAALNELSESADQRTRDKADIGRAQLLRAHGDRDKACAIARSLTNRRAGSRIERQAQLLLKTCTR
jgi:hypothetical protein